MPKRPIIKKKLKLILKIPIYTQADKFEKIFHLKKLFALYYYLIPKIIYLYNLFFPFPASFKNPNTVTIIK